MDLTNTNYIFEQSCLSFFAKQRGLLQHFFLEINIAVILDLLSSLLFFQLFQETGSLFFLLLFLQVTFSHKDHLFIDSQLLIFLFYFVLSCGLVILLSIVHNLLHSAYVLRMFRPLFSLLFFVSGPRS